MTAPKVYQAILSIQGALSKIGIAKGRKNAQQGYAFRGIDDVYAALAPLLFEHKLVIAETYSNRVETARETKNGGVLYQVVVDGRFKCISGEDGSCEVVTTFGEGMDSADKATGKAQSAAYKAACIQLFCIPVEGNEDADETTPPDSRPMAQAARKPESQANVTKQPSAAQVASVRAENKASYTKDMASDLKTLMDAKTSQELFNAFNTAKNKWPAGGPEYQELFRLYKLEEKRHKSSKEPAANPGPKFSDADPPPMDDDSAPF